MKNNDLEKIVEEKEAAKSEWRSKIFEEMRMVSRDMRVDLKGLDEENLVAFAINLNYYQNLFKHALGLVLWYLEDVVERGRYEKVVTEEIGIGKSAAARYKRHAKFLFNYPKEFINGLSVNKKQLLVNLPGELLEGFEEPEADLAGISKDEIVKLPLKELEARLKRATDGATNVLQKELGLKDQIIQELSGELEALKEERARLRDPEHKDPLKDKAILRFVAEIEYGVIRLNQYLERNPLQDHLKKETSVFMNRLDQRIDELRMRMMDLAFPGNWKPDPDRIKKAQRYQDIVNEGDNEKE